MLIRFIEIKERDQTKTKPGKRSHAKITEAKAHMAKIPGLYKATILPFESLPAGRIVAQARTH